MCVAKRVGEVSMIIKNCKLMSKTGMTVLLKMKSQGRGRRSQKVQRVHQTQPPGSPLKHWQMALNAREVR